MLLYGLEVGVDLGVQKLDGARAGGGGKTKLIIPIV